MPGIGLKSLSVRQQHLAENARMALERGQIDYALDATTDLLHAVPGCLEVRRLQRAAQLQRLKSRRPLMSRMRSRIGLVPLWLGRNVAPATVMATAERLLALDPTNQSALRLLASAALMLGWPETAAFAREALRELKPRDRANLVALGRAWLGAGRPDDALRIAQEMTRENPADPAAVELLRHASIAQTVARGRWESGGTFREKLHVPSDL